MTKTDDYPEETHAETITKIATTGQLLCMARLPQSVIDEYSFVLISHMAEQLKMDPEVLLDEVVAMTEKMAARKIFESEKFTQLRDLCIKQNRNIPAIELAQRAFAKQVVNLLENNE